GDDGYFQTDSIIAREPNREGFALTVKAGERTMTIAANEAYLVPTAPLQLDDAELVIADGSQPLTADVVNGKAVLLTSQRVRFPQGARPSLVLTLATALPTRPAALEPDSPSPAFSAGAIMKPELAEFLRGVQDARITLHS